MLSIQQNLRVIRYQKGLLILMKASRLKSQILDLFLLMMKVLICFTVLACYTTLHGSKMASKKHQGFSTSTGGIKVYEIKSDGEMIIMLYHKGFKYYVKKLFFRGVIQGRLFTKSKQEILNKFTEEFGDSPTTLVYSRLEAAALLGDMFDIVEEKVFRFDDNINLPMLGKVYPLRSLLPKYLYNKLERNFGWNLMIRAKKKC